ncbi:hypothetical protein WR25_19484 [Diploscapter pachys]|uniref:Tudor domain-containing protein n=1 Tax=Diploscapter pachys TaxID=2018661 RepID=A0A2A2K0N2_9BILA|nr:hypothetical protein WR25_19484 [Diploscapter pachys]
MKNFLILKGCPKRVYIIRIENGRVDILLADFGYVVRNLPLNVDLRALPDEKPLNVEPLVYLISLPSAFDYHPHHTETLVLREILKPKTVIEFTDVPEKRSRRKNATRVQIFVDGENVDELVKKRIEHRQIDLLCREVALVSPYSNSLKSSQKDHFIYSLLPPTCLANSHFETRILE